MASREDGPQELVARGYDRVAEEYARLEQGADWPRMRWLRDVLGRLAAGSRVLDLGCGAGIPATEEIAKRHVAVGVDVSRRQIELARRNLPEEEFIHGDVLAIDLPAGSFDAAVGFYLLDHIPRERQGELLGRVARWLRPGGLLILTAEIEDEPGVVAEWLGVDMFFSGFDPSTTKRLVREAGFEILRDEIEPQLEGGREVRYLWILGQKAPG